MIWKISKALVCRLSLVASPPSIQSQLIIPMQPKGQILHLHHKDQHQKPSQHRMHQTESGTTVENDRRGPSQHGEELTENGRFWSGIEKK